jgi:hypothetical protein
MPLGVATAQGSSRQEVCCISPRIPAFMLQDHKPDHAKRWQIMCFPQDHDFEARGAGLASGDRQENSLTVSRGFLPHTHCPAEDPSRTSGSTCRHFNPTVFRPQPRSEPRRDLAPKQELARTTFQLLLFRLAPDVVSWTSMPSRLCSYDIPCKTPSCFRTMGLVVICSTGATRSKA